MTRHDLSHLFQPGQDGDPPPELADRRVSAPLDPAVLPGGTEVRVAVRYADVREILASPSFVRRGAPVIPGLVPGLGTDPHQLTNLDPPAHTHLRSLLSRCLTPRRVEAWRPAVESHATALLTAAAHPHRSDPGAGHLTPGGTRTAGPDTGGTRGIRPDTRGTRTAGPDTRETRGSGPDTGGARAGRSAVDGGRRACGDGVRVDLVAEFAVPLSLRTLAVVLGVPDADLAEFGGWCEPYLSTAGRADAPAALGRYVLERFQAGAGLPGELRALGVPADEAVRMALTVVVSGYEPTANVLARGILRLLSTGAYGAIAAAPELLDGAVEEILRYEVPGDGGLPRVAADDVELPSGVVLRDEVVLPSMAAANRDPAAFPEPERFDILRRECPHLSFGYGMHYCLGANLARLELRAGLAALIATLPDLRPAVPPAAVRWRSGTLVRGPEELPVTW